MIVLLLLLFPLMVSNVVRAYGWVAILGRRGVINTGLRDLGLIDVPLDLLYSTEAVVVGLMTILLPYMVISIANTLSGLDPTLRRGCTVPGRGTDPHFRPRDACRCRRPVSLPECCWCSC